MLIKEKLNKRGQMSFFIIFLIVGLFISLIFIFTCGIITVKINSALDQDINLGQVNLADMNAETFGKFATMYINNADFWGMSIIFGMVMGLFLASYLLRNTMPKFAIILDIFIIVAMFIVSLYVSASYSAILDAFNSAGEPFLEQYAPKTSWFMVNLPIFVVIIGVILMVLFHSSIPRKTEEIYQQGGYLQGAY